MPEISYTNIDEYIAQYPAELQLKLQELRSVIMAAAPEAKEKISWQMPTFYMKENLIHFAVAKKHIGLYPGGEAVAVFADRLMEYKTTKGAVQLPLDKPIPYDLVTDIVKFKVEGANS